MTLKQLLWVLCVLGSFSVPVTAQSNAGSSTPKASPNAKSKIADGAKHPIVIPPEKAKPIVIPRFDKPPVIDGKLDDEVWKTAVVFRDFHQVEPGDNIAPSKPTEAFMGYDSKFLYIAYHAYDEPDKVRATIAKRDNVFNDDYVGLFFDTLNDQRKAYELNFNPLGIQADGIITSGQGEDFSVDIVHESKGMLTNDGYVVEISIPFKSLRYEAGKGKLWGVHFYRRIKRLNEELDSWMPISRDISSFLAQEGHITGLEGISTERTLELIPSLTVSETGKRVATNPQTDKGRFVNRPIKFDPGLTAKFLITPTVVLDLALNPDFAQVEADQTVVTANQRFPIFFQEKRPFFLEGIDIFRTPIQAVHTRAIIDPDVAVKLSGKRGRNTFGFLVAADKGPGNFSEEERTADNQKFVGKSAYIGILRLKRDFGRESNIGFLATSYNFIEKHNQLAGFDGRLRLDRQRVITFQLLGTTSRRFFFDPDLGQSIYRTGNALAYTFNYDKDGRHWGHVFSATGRTRDYRADLGFTRRTNTNRGEIFVRYNSEPKPKATLISWRVNDEFEHHFDFQRRLQSWNNSTQINFSFKHQTFFGTGFNIGYERIFEEEFGAKRTPSRAGTFAGNDSERSTKGRGIYTFGGSTLSKKYALFVFSGYNWNAFDFDFGAGPRFPRVSPPALAAANAKAAGLCDPKKPPLPAICNALQDPGPGNQLNVELNFNYQPTNAWHNQLSINKQRLVRNDTGRVAFDDNIFSLRSTYQFTRFIALRARVDYDTLASSVRGQFLLGWTPNPGTAFYVGYNDDLSRNGFSPFTDKLEPGFRRNGRTFFIKMSYLFRKSFGG